MKVILANVYNRTKFDEYCKFLYTLLESRDPIQNISHSVMPTWEQHIDFIKSRPYLDWEVIIVDDVLVGAYYITKHNEIGLFILPEHSGQKIGTYVLSYVLSGNRRGRMYANINPKNVRSIEFFKKNGFKFHCGFYASDTHKQDVYVKD